MGRESCGWHSLMLGWALSVSLKGAMGQTAALPHVLSTWPHECSQRVRVSLQAAARASLAKRRWASAKEIVV